MDESKPVETAAAPKPQRRRVTKRKAVENHVRSYFDALAARDARRMADHWRDDGVADVVPLGVLRGREQIAAMFAELFAALPDLETQVVRVVAGEREAAVEWRMSGTFSGDSLQGVEATGKHVTLRGLDVVEVEDGRNAASTSYYDDMTFARQIGLMPGRDSALERAMKSVLNAVTKLRQSRAAHRSGG
jgi:steroid delta-isomerase-like uncharacterized protein